MNNIILPLTMLNLSTLLITVAITLHTKSKHKKVLIAIEKEKQKILKNEKIIKKYLTYFDDINKKANENNIH